MSRKITAVRIHHGWERMLRPWKHVGRPPEMYVRLPGNLCSSAGEKNMRACGEKGGGCGKVCSAAGALFSRRKKVAAVGKFVRLREHCSAAGKRSRLWKDLFSRGSICSAAVLIVHLVLPCSFIYKNNQRDQMQKERKRK